MDFIIVSGNIFWKNNASRISISLIKQYEDNTEKKRESSSFYDIE